jgi:rsbT co-antagonist protein RsbR
MSMATTGHLANILLENQEALLEAWLGGMLSRLVRRDKLAESEIRQQASRFLPQIAGALSAGHGYDFDAPGWADARASLADISAARVRQGFSPTDTATFIFALKTPLFQLLREKLADDPAMLAEVMNDASTLFDRMGLFTIEEFQRGRESVIMRQQQELLELSTPVVQLWKDVLALPLIGTLDSARTQIVMENLLQKIIETSASIAIIDITGVPTVDTLVAQHLLKTVAAARLMGADCIISGIRPQIAQTIVHLGVNLEDVTTKATLADAFLVALKRVGATVVRAETAF